LGLSDREVDDITDFLENALYDPAFLKFDRSSTTKTFQPNRRDLTYSVYRPDLAALGAKDGFMPSGLPISVNDPLSRRDAGLEFLDVTSQAKIELTSSTITDGGRQQQDVYKITNIDSSTVIDTHLLIIVQGLSDQFRLKNASGITKSAVVVFLPNGDLEPGPKSGEPYLRVFLANGVLQPNQSIVQTLIFTRQPSAPPISYTLNLLSGQGNP
jgi:hypothetical protein